MHLRLGRRQTLEAVCALAVSLSAPSCDRARPDNAGYTSTSSQLAGTTSTSTGTANGSGGATSTSGSTPPNPFIEACPDVLNVLPCATPAQWWEVEVPDDCIVEYSSEFFGEMPRVFIDCEMVDRFSEDGGAAGAPQETENWSYDIPSAAGGSAGAPASQYQVEFYGPWCERARKAARVDFVWCSQFDR